MAFDYALLSAKTSSRAHPYLAASRTLSIGAATLTAIVSCVGSHESGGPDDVRRLEDVPADGACVDGWRLAVLAREANLEPVGTGRWFVAHTQEIGSAIANAHAVFERDGSVILASRSTSDAAAREVVVDTPPGGPITSIVIMGFGGERGVAVAYSTDQLRLAVVPSDGSAPTVIPLPNTEGARALAVALRTRLDPTPPDGVLTLGGEVVYALGDDLLQTEALGDRVGPPVRLAAVGASPVRVLIGNIVVHRLSGRQYLATNSMATHSTETLELEHEPLSLGYFVIGHGSTGGTAVSRSSTASFWHLLGDTWSEDNSPIALRDAAGSPLVLDAADHWSERGGPTLAGETDHEVVTLAAPSLAFDGAAAFERVSPTYVPRGRSRPQISRAFANDPNVAFERLPGELVHASPCPSP